MFAGFHPIFDVSSGFGRSPHGAHQHMADTRPSRRGGSADVSKVYSYVDVLRTLKRSINKGGTLYSAASPCLHASRTRLID